jgi:ribose transport system permease protein
MQSLQSNALEPTRSELKGLSAAQRLIRLVPVYGLVILTVLLILLFSILLPTTFPTLLNLRSIISDKAIILLLSLGVMIPMSAGRIDLTVGYGIVLWHILAISLQTIRGSPPCSPFWRLAPSWACSTGFSSKWRRSTVS